ncbi:MAG: hypothetical protein AAGF12_08370 [Myxococcota bacterium]
MSARKIVIASLGLALACDSAATAPTDAGGDRNAEDTGTDIGSPQDAEFSDVVDGSANVDAFVDPPREAFELVTLANCDGADDLGPDCEFSRLYDESTCAPDQRCANLAIYFAGGGMHCEDASHPMHAHLRQFLEDRSKGYVTAAACVLQTFDEAQRFPFSSETARADRLVRAITTWASGPDGPWTGENLLLSGGSHGAAALVHALVDERGFEEQRSWNVPGVRAMCLYDVPLDVYAREAAYQTDLRDCRGTRNRNICNRYGVRESPDGVTCGNVAPEPDCPDMSAPADPGCRELLEADTLSADDVGAIRLSDIRFVSCTGRVPNNPCSGGRPDDGPPEIGMANLCAQLDAESETACSLASFDGASHSDCAAVEGPRENCKEFFESLAFP